MNKAIIPLFITIFLSLIGVVGDFFIKLSGQGQKFIELKFIELKWFIIGFFVYASTAFGWFLVMKKIKLSTLGIFYGISTILFLVFVSIIYFKEYIGINTRNNLYNFTWKICMKITILLPPVVNHIYISSLKHFNYV